MSHAITWDHSECEHKETPNEDPNEHWCWPRGYVECTDPTGDCRKSCRFSGYSLCEGGWSQCNNECEGYDHPDPGVEHCTNGHILDIDECNARLFIEEDSITNGPAEPFRDGPIEVEWTGDGYQWSYA